MASGHPIEFERVIRALNASGERYVIVGGVAVVLNGVDRLTADLDVVLDLESPALGKTIEALEALGYRPSAPVEAREFADPSMRRLWREEKNMQVFSLWDPSNDLPVIDLFIEAPLDFEVLYRGAERLDLGGFEALVASVDQLIEMKSGTGRDRDQEDVVALLERRR